MLGEAYELRIEDEFLELLAGTKDRTGHENGVIFLGNYMELWDFQLHKMD